MTRELINMDTYLKNWIQKIKDKLPQDKNLEFIPEIKDGKSRIYLRWNFPEDKSDVQQHNQIVFSIITDSIWNSYQSSDNDTTKDDHWLTEKIIEAYNSHYPNKGLKNVDNSNVLSGYTGRGYSIEYLISFTNHKFHIEN